MCGECVCINEYCAGQLTYMLDHVVAMLLEVYSILADVSEVCYAQYTTKCYWVHKHSRGVLCVNSCNMASF